MREMPDLAKHDGVTEGQVVALRGVAIVAKIQKRPASHGVVVLEAHLDPIELIVGEPVEALHAAAWAR